MSTPEVRTIATFMIAKQERHFVLDEKVNLFVDCTADDGRVFHLLLKVPTPEDPARMGREIGGENYDFDLYPVWFARCNGTLIDEVAAVQYSRILDAIVLMRRAENRVGGHLLNTRPESACRYRPLGKTAVLIPIKEITVAV